MLERNYKVTYASDSLDPNPIVKVFDNSNELQDWLTMEVNKNVQAQIDEDSDLESERESLEQIEYSLVRIED